MKESSQKGGTRMPNIMIVGFDLEAVMIQKRVKRVLQEIGEGHDAITTVIEATTEFCTKNDNAPYLIVRNTKKKRAKAIAEALNKELNLDVEWEVLGGFLEAKSPSS